MFAHHPKEWTPEFFETMRAQGDPFADQVVDSVFDHGEVAAVNRTLTALIENDEHVPDDLPEIVHEYFEKSAVLPEWADPELIKIGEDLFTEFSMMGFSILGCASLPECYACASGAKVLALTGQLEYHVNRRIVETIFMVTDVMTEGGLGHGGRGIRTVQKVRLMHAAIRHLILHQGEDSAHPPKNFAEVLMRKRWSIEQDGYPVNQETLGLTYLSFSYIILRSLHKLGIHVTPERQAAYFHCWNVIGHLLGIDQRFFVTNMDDGKRLWDLVFGNLKEASDDGLHLSNVLLKYIGYQIKTSAWFGRLLPYRHIPKWLTRELVGKETAQILGIKFSLFDYVGLGMTWVAMFLLGLLERGVYKGMPFGHRLSHWVFRILVLSEAERIGNRPPFQIPDHLLE